MFHLCNYDKRVHGDLAGKFLLSIGSINQPTDWLTEEYALPILKLEIRKAKFWNYEFYLSAKSGDECRLLLMHLIGPITVPVTSTWLATCLFILLVKGARAEIIRLQRRMMHEWRLSKFFSQWVWERRWAFMGQWLIRPVGQRNVPKTSEVCRSPLCSNKSYCCSVHFLLNSLSKLVRTTD